MSTQSPVHRVVLHPFGSLGDIHPYIAIALGLKSRGHRPAIATHASSSACSLAPATSMFSSLHSAYIEAQAYRSLQLGCRRAMAQYDRQRYLILYE